MKAKEFKKQYIKRSKRKDVGVIAVGDQFWYHVHDDENIPTWYLTTEKHAKKANYTIALHPRK